MTWRLLIAYLSGLPTPPLPALVGRRIVCYDENASPAELAFAMNDPAVTVREIASMAGCTATTAERLLAEHRAQLGEHA